ncbi:hypothetical protein [Luteitalea sp.]|uniref:hypothetical protein n=1 Tax=Luteitalea sp. TaxID=2004800 RepID=UPI0025B8A3F2|nr:hypothetical protein [Luteitalea sp.]
MNVTWMRALMVGFAVTLVAGCGGGGSPTGPSATPQPSVISQSGNIDAFGTTRHSLTISRSGTMTLRATWGDASVDLDLFLAPSSCTSLYPKASCGILAASEAATGTSEQIVRQVQAGESYNVFIDNLNTTRAQAYSLTATIQ